MTDPMPTPPDADDASLLNLIRSGQVEAFGVLRARHEAAARRLARHLVASPYEVDDVVAEAFAWVLEVTRRGGGPSNAVRPYLLTALRRVCYFRLTGEPTWARQDSRQLPEPGEPFTEPGTAGLGATLVARAYLSLPERWRAVLWHAEVEQARPSDVAPLLGLTRNGVAALNRRATEGLRQSYLQRYLAARSRPECRLVAERMGAYLHDALPAADAAMVSAHLDGCDDCRAAYAELADLSGTLRGVVAPLVLGSAAAAYLAEAGEGTAASAAFAGNGRHVAQATTARSRAVAGGLIAGGRAAGAAVGRTVGRPWRRLPRRARGWVGVAGLAIAAVVAVAVTLTGNGNTPASARGPATAASQAIAGAAPAVSPSTPAASPSPALSPAPALSPGPTVSPWPATSPATAPAAAGWTGLSVSLDAYGGLMSGRFGQVVFQVTDTGTAATGTLTVSISLPAGTSVFSSWPTEPPEPTEPAWPPWPSGSRGSRGSGGSGHGGWPDADSSVAFGVGGWSCQPVSGGASCTHAAIAAGAQAQGVLAVGLSGTAACGQPVTITVTAGSAFAQATDDIRC